MDVRFFVPGNIESAYIIGAADEDGARITSSNYVFGLDRLQAKILKHDLHADKIQTNGNTVLDNQLILEIYYEMNGKQQKIGS